MGATAACVPCQVHSVFLLPLGANWDKSVNLLIWFTPWFATLHCNPILLMLDTWSLLPLKCAFCSSQIFISVTAHWWIFYSPGLCHVRLCPFSYHPAFLYTTSLCLDTRASFCMEQLFVATVNVNIMVVACKKQAKGMLIKHSCLVIRGGKKKKKQIQLTMLKRKL